MAKPFRVKRNRKEIGNWKGRLQGGQVVNLETKDATEARSRLRRARAGDFGWQAAAADEVKAVLDGDIEAEALVPEQAPKEGAGTPPSAPSVPPAPAAVAADCAAGAAAPPIPEPASQPAPDPVAEANAAAADMAGEFRETLEGAGVDLSGLMDPEFLGGLHVAAQDTLFRFAAPFFTEQKPRPFVVPEKMVGAVKILGQAWLAQLQKWNLSLDGVSPGSLILLATGGMLAVQIAALYAKDEQPAQEGAASGAV